MRDLFRTDRGRASRLVRVTLAVGVAAITVAAIVAVVNDRADCGDSRVRIGGSGAALTRGPDGYSVRVSSDNDFHVGALFWILRIGDTEFSRSSYPEFTLKTLEFPIPAEALPRLRDGDGVDIYYGSPTPPTGGTSAAPGATAANQRRQGFATLHIPQECQPLRA